MNEQKDFIINIKYYQILLISIILSPLLIINSNNILNRINQEKIDKEADIKFNKIIFGRNLESFQEGMDEICNRTSDELKNFYVNKAIETFDNAVTEEDSSDKNPEYINALIDIIKGATDDDSEKSLTDNGKTYGMHMFGVFLFLAIAILSIPGWIVCCSCCCCNCYCCCCCTKPVCKLPFFIITTVLYLLVIAVCAFGLIKSNSIFIGLSDTECSILKFCNEVIEGESSDQKPKWIGIDGIYGLLDRVVDKIDELGDSTLEQLRSKKAETKEIKDEFEALLQTNSEKIAKDDDGNKETIEGNEYKLDISTKEIYGLFDNTNKKASSKESFMGLWYEQYYLTANQSESSIDEATTKFTKVLEEDTITENLGKVNDSIKEIGDSIDGIKDGIAETIVQLSNYIDEYGKLGFKIFFAFLMGIDAAIAILMFLLFFFSGKLCNNCCICRCLFKFLLHLLWNIFAFFMIITFLIGFLFSFVGTIGKDLVYVVNYFIGESNLNKDKPTLFGEEGKKLNICFNGDGKILDEIDGLNPDEMNVFDELRTINQEIEDANRQFQNLKQEEGVYGEMMNQLKERADYTKTDFTVNAISDTTSQKSYVLSDLIKQLNDAKNSDDKEWSFNCEESTTTCYNPKNTKVCSIYSAGTTNEIGKKIDAITTLVKIENNEVADKTENFKSLTEELKLKYDEFLNSEVAALNIFNNTIVDLTGIFEEYIGEGSGVFDFINCKFIGKNINVILSNLKNNLGGDIYKVGVCLLVAGSSMAISIIFTILLIVIINKSVDEAKKEQRNNLN